MLGGANVCARNNIIGVDVYVRTAQYIGCEHARTHLRTHLYDTDVSCILYRERRGRIATLLLIILHYERRVPFVR